MRNFIDSILSFIGTSSLTDPEFDSLTIESADYNQETYDAIYSILESRESISTLDEKLIAYFQAAGFDPSTPQDTGSSNIFVGGVI
jgi:hypothetical protein